jgi:glycosyltransferase involved in cell wall biosynthesis
MKTNPLFSTLIATYNNGVFLNDAIESVLSQKKCNLEIIIVDDASTDNTQDILNRVQNDGRIHVFRNEKNMGCGYTKRRCVELSSGSICGFLDADDVLCSDDTIETMVHAHIKHKKCSLIYSQYYHTDIHLNRLSVSSHQHSIPEGETFLTDKAPGGISHFATFKKEYYNKTIGIDEHLMRAVDTDLYLKLEEVGDLMFIPMPLYCYRETESNISLGNVNQQKAMYWEFIARYNACIRRNVSVEDSIFFFLDRAFEIARKESFEEGCTIIRKTKSYLLGKKIISPLKRIIDFFH